MAAIDFTAPTMPAAARHALTVRVGRRVADAVRAWRNRRAFYRLAEMSDVELHDIGLTRGDLNVPLDLGGDPTAHLGRHARQRIDRMETWARFTA